MPNPSDPPGLPPRALLRLDAAGAAVPIVMLGFVLRTALPITGMPTDTLALLAILPAVFLAYDLGCLRTARADSPGALMPIAAMNISYCILSVACMVAGANQMTPVGWVYFVGEVVIVATLSATQAVRSGCTSTKR